MPRAAWDKDWVVHLKAVGSGQHALAYLARYVFRVALCNSRLVKLENDHVTFSYREPKTQRMRFCTLPVLSLALIRDSPAVLSRSVSPRNVVTR